MLIDTRIRKILRIFFGVLPILFWILLIFGFDIPYVAVITLLCAAIHELAHIAATLMLKDAFSFRGAFSGLRLSAKEQLSYKDEALIAAAGPMANFALFLSTLPHLHIGGYVAQLGIISFLTGISNLLPIEGYDGYRIIECVARMLGAGELFFRTLKALSFALICALTFFALYFMNRLDGGYWIFFIFITILIKSMKNGKKMVFERKREKKRDFGRF